MKRALIALAAVAASFALTGCFATSSASITKEGVVSGMDSRDMANVMKAQNRSATVTGLVTTMKPIFELKAIKGQTITMSGVESITVNVPMDLATLLTQTTDTPSDAVQVINAIGGVVQKATPVLGALVAGSVAKTISDNAALTAQMASQERQAATAALAEAGKQKAPIFVPEGFTAAPD